MLILMSLLFFPWQDLAVEKRPGRGNIFEAGLLLLWWRLLLAQLLARGIRLLRPHLQRMGRRTNEKLCGSESSEKNGDSAR